MSLQYPPLTGPFLCFPLQQNSLKELSAPVFFLNLLSSIESPKVPWKYSCQDQQRLHPAQFSILPNLTATSNTIAHSLLMLLLPGPQNTTFTPFLSSFHFSVLCAGPPLSFCPPVTLKRCDSLNSGLGPLLFSIYIYDYF